MVKFIAYSVAWKNDESVPLELFFCTTNRKYCDPEDIFAVLSTLVRAGAPVTDEALHKAVKLRCGADAVRLLLDHGADVNSEIDLPCLFRAVMLDASQSKRPLLT